MYCISAYTVTEWFIVTDSSRLIVDHIADTSIRWLSKWQSKCPFK